MPLHEHISVGAVSLEHGGERPAGEADTALYDHLDPYAELERLMPSKRLFGLHFDEGPVRGRVTPLIGNTVLYIVGTDETGDYPREVQTNLVIAAPNPCGNPEEQRKAELVGAVYPAFDLIVAHHGTDIPDFSYALCHEQASPAVWNTINAFGIEHVTHPQAPSTSALLPNYVAIDFPPNSYFTAAGVQELLSRIAIGEQFKQRKSITKYCCERNILRTEAVQLGLPQKMEPFTEFSPEHAQALGLPLGTVAIAAGMQYGKWYAETGRPIDVGLPPRESVVIQ